MEDFYCQCEVRKLSNDAMLSEKKIDKDLGNPQLEVEIDRCEEPPILPHQTPKKLREGESTQCMFERLPEAIVHDIFSRLPIVDLLIAAKTCSAWHRMISSCKIFQELYDQRNQESGIVLGCPTQKTNQSCLFHINSSRWYFPQGECQPVRWFLQGAVDGLMLFVSREGKLAVVNPLTKQHRLLPDTMVNSSLSLESCLMKKSWCCVTTPLQMRPCINIVVDPADQKKFKVMVCGELITEQVHVLVYSSATDKWSTKLCSEEICYTFFRKRLLSIVDGNTIYFNPKYGHRLVSYNTQYGRFLYQRAYTHGFSPLSDYGGLPIGIFTYRNRLHLLAFVSGSDGIAGPLTDSVGLWHLHRLGSRWDLVTKHTLQYSSFDDDVVAAYDGMDCVTIIPSTGSVVALNLDSKEWRMISSAPTSARIAPRQYLSAFHMKLKFSSHINPCIVGILLK